MLIFLWFLTLVTGANVNKPITKASNQRESSRGGHFIIIAIVSLLAFFEVDRFNTSLFDDCKVLSLKVKLKSLKISNISQPTLSLPGGQWLRLKQRLRLLPQHERGHKREGVHGGHGPDELVRKPEGQVVGRLPQHALLVDSHLLRDLLVADHAEALACHLLLPLAPRRGRGAVQEDEALLRHLRVHLEGLLPEGLLSGGGFCSGTQQEKQS